MATFSITNRSPHCDCTQTWVTFSHPFSLINRIGITTRNTPELRFTLIIDFTMATTCQIVTATSRAVSHITGKPNDITGGVTLTPQYIYVQLYTENMEKSARPVPDFVLFLIFPRRVNTTTSYCSEELTNPTRGNRLRRH